MKNARHGLGGHVLRSGTVSARERRGSDDDKVRNSLESPGGLGDLLRLGVHAGVDHVLPAVLLDELLGEVRIVEADGRERRPFAKLRDERVKLREARGASFASRRPYDARPSHATREPGSLSLSLSLIHARPSPPSMQDRHLVGRRGAQKSMTNALLARSVCSDDALSSAKSVIFRSGAWRLAIVRERVVRSSGFQF